MCTPGSHSQTWPIPFCRSKIHILPEMAPEGQHLVTEHNCSQQRESLSDSRISNGCRNAAFRADLYIQDLIRHKSHYFPVTFVVFSQFVLSVEAERLKAAVFCLRDQTADTQKENNFKPCSWVKFLHLQTVSAAGV